MKKVFSKYLLSLYVIHSIRIICEMLKRKPCMCICIYVYVNKLQNINQYRKLMLV